MLSGTADRSVGIPNHFDLLLPKSRSLNPSMSSHSNSAVRISSQNSSRNGPAGQLPAVPFQVGPFPPVPAGPAGLVGPAGPVVQNSPRRVVGPAGPVGPPVPVGPLQACPADPVVQNSPRRIVGPAGQKSSRRVAVRNSRRNRQGNARPKRSDEPSADEPSINLLLGSLSVLIMITVISLQ